MDIRKRPGFALIWNVINTGFFLYATAIIHTDICRLVVTPLFYFQNYPTSWTANWEVPRNRR